MSIFRTALRANDTRTKIALESEQEVDQVQVDQVIPAGDSNVTGTNTETPAGLTKGEEQGVEVPGEALDVTNLLEAEAQADEVIEASAERAAEAAVTEVAMEAITTNLQRCLRAGFALEQLSEQLQATVEGDGEGISPQMAQMVITANDALSGSTDVITKEDDSADPTDTGEVAGVPESGGEAEGGQVFGQGNPALESFIYSPRIATESLAEEAANKASAFFKTVADTIKRVTGNIKKRLSDFAVNFKGYSALFEKLVAEKEVLASQGGQPLNEAAVTKLRQHLPLSGSGNKFLLSNMSRDITTLYRIHQEVNQVADDFNRAVLNGGADVVLKEAQRLFANLSRKFSKKTALIELMFEAPSFSTLEELAALAPRAVKMTAKSVNASSSQTYTVLTEKELEGLAKAVEYALESIYNHMEEIPEGISEQDLKKKFSPEGEATPEEVAKLRLARKAYATASLIAVNASIDASASAIDISDALTAHAAMLARLSFKQAREAA